MHREGKMITVCRGCQLIECLKNTRMQPPKCALEEIELDEKAQCAMFDIDYQYRRNQFREKIRARTSKLNRSQ